MLDTLRLLYRDETAPLRLNRESRYSYLKATVKGKTAVLVLGNIDRRAEGLVEVWYSGSGEVIRLVDGHLAGSAGLGVNWRSTRFSRLPSWQADAVKPDTEAVPPSRWTYVRERDLMPGYRFGIRDEVVRIRIAAPQDAGFSSPFDQSLQWYEERCISFPSASSLPPARFAVSFLSGAPQVVYSEQCLANDLCMSFERYVVHPAPAVSPAGAGS